VKFLFEHLKLPPPNEEEEPRGNLSLPYRLEVVFDGGGGPPGDYPDRLIVVRDGRGHIAFETRHSPEREAEVGEILRMANRISK
jgi:hypothetical protein